MGSDADVPANGTAGEWGHHTLGRGYEFGFHPDNPQRAIYSSILNFTPLHRSVHNGPLRDASDQWRVYVRIARENVMEAVGQGRYELNEQDETFLVIAEKCLDDRRHRAAPMTPTIFQDRIAAPVHAKVLACLCIASEKAQLSSVATAIVFKVKFDLQERSKQRVLKTNGLVGLSVADVSVLHQPSKAILHRRERFSRFSL